MNSEFPAAPNLLRDAPSDASGDARVSLDQNRPIAISFRRSYARRVQSGFMKKYFSGNAVLDIGYRGGDPNAVPITESAIGVERDYPNYDGVHLPFPDQSQDTVLAAHVLEHIPDYRPVLKDWLRVLKIGGYLVIIVPHRDLFERKADLPSRWNGDHKRFYTPASLLNEIEESLAANSYRLRHLVDNDHGFDYSRPPTARAIGGYEIELVLEKIKPPTWSDQLRYPPEIQKMVSDLDDLIVQAVTANLMRKGDGSRWLKSIVSELLYFPPWSRLRRHFVDVEERDLRGAVDSLLEIVKFDAEAYAAAYPDISRRQGSLRDLRSHWLKNGYFEGRQWTAPLG